MHSNQTTINIGLFLNCSSLSYRSYNFTIGKLSLFFQLLHFCIGFGHWFIASFLYFSLLMPHILFIALPTIKIKCGDQEKQRTPILFCILGAPNCPIIFSPTQHTLALFNFLNLDKHFLRYIIKHLILKR